MSEHFARAGFAVDASGSKAISVTLPDAPDEAQGRREIRAQLLVWSVLHPDDPGVIV
ncbi:MAG TPA: hypothetical protein VK915_06085 [Gaiellaceae bacterium]|nr:hypothetical protein [Gaiellaceae bacterium]